MLRGRSYLGGLHVFGFFLELAGFEVFNLGPLDYELTHSKELTLVS